MNVLLWIVQSVLALLALAGGSYKVFKTDELLKVPSSAALPRGGWVALGLFEMLCGILLIVPAALKWMPALTPLAATALALETATLAAIFARYSLKLNAANPMVWQVAMAVMAAFVAFGRYVLSPVA